MSHIPLKRNAIFAMSIPTVLHGATQALLPLAY